MYVDVPVPYHSHAKVDSVSLEARASILTQLTFGASRQADQLVFLNYCSVSDRYFMHRAPFFD